MAGFPLKVLAVCALLCCGGSPSAGSGSTPGAPECTHGSQAFVQALTPPLKPRLGQQVREFCLRPWRAFRLRQQQTSSRLALRAVLSEKEQAEDMWLEEVESDKALSWVKERNEETLQALGDPNDSELQSRILKILDSKDKIPYVAKRGKFLYNLWTDDANPRGLWRRTTMEEFAKSEPAWETVLDIDALGKAEGESWVWGGTTRPDLGPSVEASRLLISLSRGGSDATVVREFDLEAKRFIPPEEGGFHIPEAKSSVEYRSLDELLVGTDTGEGSLTTSGYPREVRVWKRGTALGSAEVVFEGEPDDVSAVSYVSRHGSNRYEWRQRAISFYTTKYWLRPLPVGAEEALDEQEGWVQLEVPEGAVVSAVGDQLLIKLREAWTAGGKEHPAGSLLAAAVSEVSAKGAEAAYTVLFAPTARRSLNSWSVTKGCLVLSLLDTVKTRLQLWRWDETQGRWEEGEMGREGRIESLSVWAVDDDEDDRVWVMSSSYTQPPSLSIMDLAAGLDGPRQLLKSLPAQFDAAGLTAQQFEAESRDGTKVPYFVVSRTAAPLDGSTPTLVYAYGGFEVSLTPSYGAVTGAAWLEKGGCYVIANIRGGGEFGPEWHRAALREKRQNAYEDLFAVCSKLIADGVTSPSKLGFRGGSNGGLLAGNALVQRSDLLGAVVGEVPLLDMRRFHKLLAGSSWVAEYGDPDTDDWEYLQHYSPYHCIDRVRVRAPAVTDEGRGRGSKKTYSPVLFTTSTRDDRVHPGHARKMVKRLRDTQDTPTYYYENIEGGHGGAADNKQRAFMQTLVYSFLWKQLGNK